MALPDWTHVRSGLVIQERRISMPGEFATTIEFQAGGRQTQSDFVRQGQPLTIKYDPQRTTGCRGHHDGMPAWDIFANVRFAPSGEVFQGPLVQHYNPEGSGGIFDPPRPIPFAVNVPADATEAEIWFLNRNAFGCMAWDSQFGNNYRFEVAQAGPAQPVMFRTGAERSLEMVNVFRADVSKTQRTFGSGPGSELETHLSLKAWVRNVAYQKNVWIDLHVFDPNDNLVSAQTLTLSYSGAAGGNGDFFTLDQEVFQGSGGVPGSVWPRADARRLQYRLYYEVNGHIFTDGILHQHAINADAAAHRAVAAAA